MRTPLIIDPEFEAMCPPLTDEEYEQLEDNIVSEGEILMPLIVWDGVIIDGHNRYKIAQAYPAVKFSIRDKVFSNRYEAMSWICKNQLGRRNLSAIQRKVLIGRQFENEKAAHGGERGTERNSSGEFAARPQDEVLRCEKTSHRIARENNVSHAYVDRAGEFVRGIDAAEDVLPGIKQEILSGAIKPTQNAVASVAKAPPEARRQMAEELRKPKEKDNTHVRAIPTSSKSSRQELKEVRAIYADMMEPTGPVSEDSVLETLQGAVTDMIRVCDMLFEDFPRLLEDRAYKAKVIEIMQEPKCYILQIEGDAK